MTEPDNLNQSLVGRGKKYVNVKYFLKHKTGKIIMFKGQAYAE